jgi:class 3 adenylate cyclase
MEESLPPYPTGPGQRMLAAIVFTDVVSFSARMQEDEVTTMKLVDRDFTLMRKWCEKHSGSVLKSTGDGLLLYFTSAVHAVAYALKMQRTFTEGAKTQSDEETLTHRVGVHLGDVFLNDKDVMGDGVNIAARLQSEAEPGGICISQTVYDVVKNKMELDVVKMSPRKLKNISEAITMYNLLLEPPRANPAAGRGQQTPSFSPVEEAPALTLTKKQKLLALVLLLGALGVGTWFVVQKTIKIREELERSSAAQEQLDAAVAQRKVTSERELPRQNPETPASASLVTGAPAPVGPAIDFAALTLVRAGAKSTAPDPVARQEAKERMKVLLLWLNKDIQVYNKDRPLLMRELGGAVDKNSKVFTGPDQRVYFAEGGAIVRRDLMGLKSSVLGAVIVSALIDLPTAPDRELINGAEAFAYYYELPEMIDALRNRSMRGDRK